jgi:6-phosphogluconolactonase (cycloisomerase 2 family)
MKNLKYGILLTLLLVALTATLRAEFLYVSSSYAKGLLSFSVNNQTGALIELPSYLEGVGSLAYDHWNGVLYIGQSVDIAAYRVKPNGLLQALPGSPFKVPGGILALDPFNRFLYASGTPPLGGIAVYRIEYNGSLQAVHGSPFGSGNSSIAVDPFGRFLYTVDNKEVATYRILETGALLSIGTPVSVLPAGQLASVVKVDPTGRFLYALSEEGADISTFRIRANGSLTSVAGSPTTPFNGPWYQNEAVDPLGHYLYALAGTSSLLIYRINIVTGLLEFDGQAPDAGSDIDNNPVGITLDPSGKFVFMGDANGVVDPGPMTLRVYKVGFGGSLTLAPGSPYYPVGVGPVDRGSDPSTHGYPSSMVVAP